MGLRQEGPGPSLACKLFGHGPQRSFKGVLTPRAVDPSVSRDRILPFLKVSSSQDPILSLRPLAALISATAPTATPILTLESHLRT
jgi:hypothetical protein